MCESSTSNHQQRQPNRDLYLAREVSGDYFSLDNLKKLDDTETMQKTHDESAELDAVLANVNRLLESLGSDFDSNVCDNNSNYEIKSNKDDVTGVCEVAQHYSDHDVRPGSHGSHINDFREKSTAKYREWNDVKCLPGADKHGLSGSWKQRRNDQPISPQFLRESRTQECLKDISRESRSTLIAPSTQRGSLLERNHNNQLTKNANTAGKQKARVVLKDEHIKPLLKSRSYGEIYHGHFSISESTELEDVLNNPVIVKRGSPVISRHRSLQEDSVKSENCALKFNQVSSTQLYGNLDIGRPVNTQGQQDETERINTWLSDQQIQDYEESSTSVRRHKRFSSLTQSSPFKFAQLFIPGTKRKISSAKSLPSHLQEADIKGKTCQDDYTAVTSSRDGPCHTTKEKRWNGDKTPQISSRSTEPNVNQVKKKFPITKSLFFNFRRSVSLEETQKSKSLLRNSTASQLNYSNNHRKKQTGVKLLGSENFCESSNAKTSRISPVTPNRSTCENQTEAIKTSTSLRSQPFHKLSVKNIESEEGQPEFFLFEGNTQIPTRRATMDCAQRLPKQVELRGHSSFSSQECDKPRPFLSVERRTYHASLTREKDNGLPLGHYKTLNNPNAMVLTGANMSCGSEDSSEDSLNEWSGLHKVQRHSSDKYLKKQSRVDPTDAPDLNIELSRTGTTKKGKINKIRRSLKQVGKAATSPITDTEDMADRIWGPEGNCTWSNMSGRKMQLGSTRLQSLSELECDALQKVAVHRLAESDLGITVSIPKDESKILNRKISMRKKYGVHLSVRDKTKDKGIDHVFGIPLVEVVENDQLLRLQKSATFAATLDFSLPGAADRDALNDNPPVAPSNQQQDGNYSSSSCSGSATSIPLQPETKNVNISVQRCLKKASSCESLNLQEYSPTDPDNVFRSPNYETISDTKATLNSISNNMSQNTTSIAARPLKRRGAIAADSLNEIDPYQSQLLEALSLSVSGKTHNQRSEKKRSLLPPTMAQVPYVVQKCCDHITKYGLNTTGIFRVAGSKKRVKQLREEFDRGVDVTIDEDYNPHDVAALLKEFFRDLPEAVLTRDLYHAFIQTAKLAKGDRLQVLRSLVWLLPLTNRDTLFTLLNFLSVVAAHSEDSIDTFRNKVTGNKMGASNLATIFGPNILHRYKKTQTSNDNPYQIQSMEKAEDSGAVITVVEEIITNYTQLFQIVKYDHDQMLRTLNENDPEAVDFLLRRKAANYMREKSKMLTMQSSLSTNNNHPNNNNNCNNPNDSPGAAPREVTIDCSCQNSEVKEKKIELLPSKPQSGMRLSYQQATGHVSVLIDKEQQAKSGKLKFKRPTFKQSNPSSLSRSDMTKHSNDNNSRNSSSSSIEEEPKLVETQPSVAELKKIQTVIKTLRDAQRASPTNSSIAISKQAMDNRSMSFTEDDLQDILQPSEYERTLPKQREATPTSSAPFIDSNSKDQLHGNISEGMTEDSYIAQLSDSGISMDTFTFSSQMTESDSIHAVKRQGGFSVRQTESNSGETFDSSDSFITSEESEQSHNDNRAQLRPHKVDYGKTSSITDDHKPKPRRFVSKLRFEPSSNTNNSNNTNSGSINEKRHLATLQHFHTRTSSKVVQLCDGDPSVNQSESSLITNIEPQSNLGSHLNECTKGSSKHQLKNLNQIYLHTKPNHKHGDVSFRTEESGHSLSLVGHTDFSPSNGSFEISPNSDHRFRLQIKELPRSTRRVQDKNNANRKTKTQQEQEDGNVTLHDSRNNLHPSLKCIDLPEALKSATHTNVFDKTINNITDTAQNSPGNGIKMPYNHRNGRRYSKDDMNLTVAAIRSSSSRWTSSGYLPKNSPMNFGTNSTSHSKSRETSWKCDQSKLPETWV